MSTYLAADERTAPDPLDQLVAFLHWLPPGVVWFGMALSLLLLWVLVAATIQIGSNEHRVRHAPRNPTTNPQTKDD